ncbi:hypothetical protein ACSSS7_007194 [Eimeria intestinalis]
MLTALGSAVNIFGGNASACKSYVTNQHQRRQKQHQQQKQQQQEGQQQREQQEQEGEKYDRQQRRKVQQRQGEKTKGQQQEEQQHPGQEPEEQQQEGRETEAHSQQEVERQHGDNGAAQVQRQKKQEERRRCMQSTNRALHFGYALRLHLMRRSGRSCLCASFQKPRWKGFTLCGDGKRISSKRREIKCLDLLPQLLELTRSNFSSNSPIHFSELLPLASKFINEQQQQEDEQQQQQQAAGVAQDREGGPQQQQLSVTVTELSQALCFLPSMKRSPDRWDLLVLDPPALRACLLGLL